MNTKVRSLLTLLVSLTVALAIFGGSAQGADKKGRTEISAGERALAMMEVQSIFSKHAFYHQASKHCEEIADIWVAENGPNAKTARWTLSGSTILQGIDKVKDKYCTQHVAGQKKTLEEMSKKYPSIKNIPENLTVGSEYVMHTQETPVIEVAGDGKTAKMMCYSIGLAVRGSVDEKGNTSVSSGWMWEKYAVDFVKENGVWKIWHLLNLMDQGPSESQGNDNTAQAPSGQTGDKGGQGGAPSGQGGDKDGQGGAPGGQGGAGGEQTSKYFKYSPTSPLKIDPPFPEPYYTFSETTEY